MCRDSGVVRLQVVKAPERRTGDDARLDRARRADPGSPRAERLQFDAQAAHAHPIERIRHQSRTVTTRRELHRRGFDRGEVGADSGEVGSRSVRVERVSSLQGVVSGPGVEIVQPPKVGPALGGDAPPLLVHVVLAGGIVLGVRVVGPRGIGVVDVEVLLLSELPPAVAPLERQTPDGVAHPALATRMLVDLLPLAQQVARLGHLILAHLAGVPGIGPEFCEHDRDAEFVLDLLKHVAEGDAPINVGPKYIESLRLFGDDVDVLEVAVRDGHRPLRVARLDSADDLAEQRIQRPGPSRFAFTFRQVLRFRAGPLEAVVVLVPEQPHQHPGDIAELVDQSEHLGLDRLAQARVRIVDIRVPYPTDVEPVAAHRVVEHGEDAVALIDVTNPARRDADVLPDRVHAHALEQRHLAGEGRLDDIIGLSPEVVGVVRADREVVPVHPEDHEVPAIDLEPVARVVRDDPDFGDLRGGVGRCDEQKRENGAPESGGGPAGFDPNRRHEKASPQGERWGGRLAPSGPNGEGW